MNEYPSDQDYKVIVEEKYGRDNTQQFLKKHSHVLVHSNATKDLANVTRRMYMGYTQTNLLKEDVLEQDSRKKATAFILESEADSEELIEDLESASRRGHIFDENKQIQVRDVKKTEEGFDINLEYEDRNASRRTLLNSQSKSVSVSITQTDKDDIQKGMQEYRHADEFNAASDFFESWRSKRLRERQSEVKRVNFNLEKLPPEDRVDLFTEFLQTHPGSWRFEKVLELGIKQSGESSDLIDEESETVEAEEEIEEELDENLRGITNAVLKGTGLRENQFVQDCLDSGFYFSSVRGLFDDLDSTDSMELELKFKESPKKTFDISIVEEHERTDDGYDPGNLGSEKRAEVRDLFRNVIVDLYGDYTDEPALIEDKYGTDSLTDLENIGDQIADRLVSEGYDTPEKIFEANPEDLEDKIEGIGEETAKNLTGNAD